MLFLLQRVGKSVSLSEPVRVPCNLFGAERGKRNCFSFLLGHGILPTFLLLLNLLLSFLFLLCFCFSVFLILDSDLTM